LAGWQLIESLKSALDADGEALLSADEHEAITTQMTKLQALLEGEDEAAIRALTEQLGHQSEAFATRRMDKSIRAALAGVSLDSLDEGTTP
jgi:molecular chaperone HscA